ncbi:acyl-CoA dehydrogenase family protein [Catelliglobosispora koreensis]|uniref:acyl-CoA dehydrogenase family protein n=1 Tax=Catelliglobosispora koreensis TaxID=129052 RepID=UPI0003A46EA9|nr:acyl-CoA dehydrogenase family protein [Catelliglobosispora koreensis]
MNPEQEQFRSSLHSLLAASDVPSIARAWAAGSCEPGLAMWRKLADLGVTALAIPAEYDGLEATATDLVIAFEELGHHAVPGPAIESVAVVPSLILSRLPETAADPAVARASDVASLASQWLPRFASGETLATLAWPPHQPFAVDAHIAALPFGGTPGETVASVDPTRHLSHIESEHFIGGRNDRAFDLGALACAAQLTGLGQAMLDLSVAYVQQRVQFGQPVGKFQAVKHHLADVRIALDFARPLVYSAAESLAPQDISAAKVAASAAAQLAARSGLQVHGAIAYTREYDFSLWLVKARALLPAWGTASWHRNRLLESL